jgi:hypothetical protein
MSWVLTSQDLMSLGPNESGPYGSGPYETGP